MAYYAFRVKNHRPDKKVIVAAAFSYRRLLRKVGVGTDIATTVLLQGAGALLAYLVNRSVNRSLGPDGWDAYSLCMHNYILIGTAVADFGIIAVVMPRLAAARGEFSGAFGAAFILRLFTCLMGLAVAATLAAAYGNYELILPVVVGFGAVLFSGKMTGLRQVSEMVWRLKGRTWVISLISVVDALLLLGTLYVLDSYNALTVLNAMIALVATNVPGFVVVMLPIYLAYRRSGYAGRPIPKRYYRGIIVAALPIAAMAVTAQFFARAELLVIDATIGREYVGDYVAGILPLAGTIFLAVTVGVGLWPLISQIHRRARKDVAADWVISLGSRLLGGIAIGLSMVCFLFAEQIMAFFDPAYVEYAYILRIYSITSGLEYLVVFFDQTLLAVELRKEMMIGTLLSLGLVLVFQFVAISQWGIPGILIGKIAALCCKIAYQLLVLGRVLPGIRSGALKAFARLGAAAVPPSLALAFTGGLPLFARAGIVLAVTAASLLALRIVDLNELKTLRRLQIS